MPLSVRPRWWAGLTAGVLALAAPIAVAAGAQASTTPSNTPTTVPTGILAPALKGATAFDTTNPSTAEQVSFIMKERDKSALESKVTGGLKNFQSVSRFARSYGANPTAIKELTSYLAGFGIKTKVYADDVDVSATGTAGEFNSALSISTKNFHVPAEAGVNGNKVKAQTVYSATKSPKVPARFAGDILAILGLTNYAPFTTSATHTPSSTTEAAKATSSGIPGSYLPSNFADDSDLSGVYKKTDGAGETIGIVTLAALDQGAPQYFWKNIAGVPITGRTVSTVNVDGGPGAPSDVDGTGETDIDVEQSGGVAPGADIIVYQAPNTDPGFADAFFDAASSNKVSSLSASWGESETIVAESVAAGEETTAYEAAFDEAFLELGDQGTSVFASSGDSGAYDDSDEPTNATTELAVDTPGDSPYITSAGGTTTPWSGSITGPDGSAPVSVTKQRAWGWDYLWPAVASVNGVSYADAAVAEAVGDGGGYSVVEPKPVYQDWVSGTSNFHAVENLTPDDFQVTVPGTNFTEPTSWSVNQPPPLTSGHGSGRAEPDVSADADPESGYLLYEPSAVQSGNPVLESGWGGTSFVAPQMNAASTLIDAYVGHRIGLLNPTVYSLAGTSISATKPLNTVGSSNDNLYYTGNPGEDYNPATGLGTVNFTTLAKDVKAGR